MIAWYWLIVVFIAGGVILFLPIRWLLGLLINNDFIREAKDEYIRNRTTRLD